MSADIPKWESGWFASFALMPNALVPWGHRQSAYDVKPAFVLMSPETTWEHFHHQPPPSVTVNLLCVQTHTAFDCTSGINTVQCYISCPLGWLFIGIWIYGTALLLFLSSILKWVHVLLQRLGWCWPRAWTHTVICWKNSHSLHSWKKLPKHTFSAGGLGCRFHMCNYKRKMV